MKLLLIASTTIALAGCAGTQVTRTSQNTMLVDAGAAPICGARGAARVASKSAAIETIRAGFDKYMIGGAQSQNNIHVSQMPGQIQTSGSFSRGGFQATSTYVPGPTVVSGSHDRTLAIVMFKNGDPGSEQALDARQQLGPDWQEVVENRILTCL